MRSFHRRRAPLAAPLLLAATLVAPPVAAQTAQTPPTATSGAANVAASNNAASAAPPAAAQTLPAATLSAPPPASGPYGMPLQDWQGLSCIWGGVVGGFGVFYYSDVLTAAATGMTNPLLLVPLVATGFLGGCSVGANSAPGLTWLYRHM